MFLLTTTYSLQNSQ